MQSLENAFAPSWQLLATLKVPGPTKIEVDIEGERDK